MKKKYTIIDTDGSVLQTFDSKRACRAWLMEGIYACEGAERDHYVHMMAELDCGHTTLHYWTEGE